MRVGLDATPLLGPRTGVGTYTAELIRALVDIAPKADFRATAFTARGTAPLADALPPRVRIHTRHIPARVLRAAWLRVPCPPAEALVGRIDVFHGTNFVSPPTRRASSVVTVHDLSYLRFPETVATATLAYTQLVPRAISRGAHVCTPSRSVAHEVLDTYRIDAERVHPTPLGVDPVWFDAAEADGAHAPGGPPYVLAVGTLEPRKNLTTLIEAYRLAAARRIALPRLLLVGAQGWGARLDTTGLDPDQVVRAGHLPFDELRRTVARASALVFPSTYEGFGLPPLEALACGIPVLAADLPVTREVLGEQARFVEATSPEALLDGLQRTLADPAGTAASRRAHAREFTWRACAEATLAAYRQARQG